MWPRSLNKIPYTKCLTWGLPQKTAPLMLELLPSVANIIWEAIIRILELEKNTMPLNLTNYDLWGMRSLFTIFFLRTGGNSAQQKRQFLFVFIYWEMSIDFFQSRAALEGLCNTNLNQRVSHFHQPWEPRSLCRDGLSAETTITFHLMFPLTNSSREWQEWNMPMFLLCPFANELEYTETQ
jgi:hypothetical protein